MLGYTAIFVAALAACLMLLAAVAQGTAHRPTPWRRRLWPVFTLALTGLFLGAPTALGVMIRLEGIEPLWFATYMVSLTSLYLVGAFCIFSKTWRVPPAPVESAPAARTKAVWFGLLLLLTLGLLTHKDLEVRLKAATIYHRATLDAFRLLPPVPGPGKNVREGFDRAYQAMGPEEKLPAWFRYKDWAGLMSASPADVDGFLETQKPALEALRTAVGQPGYHLDVDLHRLIASPLPPFSQTRTLGNLLALSAQSKARNHDPEGALADLDVLADMADRLNSWPTMITVMAAVSLDKTRVMALETVLPAVPEETLIRERVQNPRPALASGLTGAVHMEAAALRQALAELGQGTPDSADVFSPMVALGMDDSLATGFGAPAALLFWRVFLLPADFQSLEEKVRRMEEDAGQPYWVLRKQAAPSGNGLESPKGGLLTAMAMIDINRFHERVAEGDARRRLAGLALALRLYVKTHGKYPDRIQDIESLAWAGSSVDPYTGSPFKMETTNEGLVLSSAGSAPMKSGDPPQPIRFVVKD
jgi:hypothetical protein